MILHNFNINFMYLPKINLISLSSFELCRGQIYYTHTHTHTHTHSHTHTHTYTHTHARTHAHTHIFSKTHISTQGAQKYRKSSKSRGQKISPLPSFLFQKAKWPMWRKCKHWTSFLGTRNRLSNARENPFSGGYGLSLSDALQPWVLPSIPSSV